MWKNVQRLWSRLSTAAKVIVILVACALVGGVFDAMGVATHDEQRSPASVATTAKAPKSAKDIAKSVYGHAFRDATESEGRILVAFDAWTITRQSVEGDVSRFMSELMRQGDGFDDVTISAYATYTNKATGAQTHEPCFTVSFSYEQAKRVVSWARVDVRAAGTVEFVDPALK